MADDKDSFAKFDRCNLGETSIDCEVPGDSTASSTNRTASSAIQIREKEPTNGNSSVYYPVMGMIKFVGNQAEKIRKVRNWLYGEPGNY